jgi:hypothetical protein
MSAVTERMISRRFSSSVVEESAMPSRCLTSYSEQMSPA